MNLTHYLQSVREQLRLPQEKSDDILAEIHSHLLEDIRHHTRNGMAREAAVKRACHEFGHPDDVARAFMKSAVGFFRTPTRIIVIPLLLLVSFTMIRRAAYEIPIFENALEPFYTDEWAFFLIEAIFSYVFVAVFLYRKLQRIARSPKEFKKFLVMGVGAVFALDLVRNIVPDALNNFSAFYLTPTGQDIARAVLSEVIAHAAWIVVTMIFPIFLLASLPTPSFQKRTQTPLYTNPASRARKLLVLLFPFLITMFGVFLFLTSVVFPVAFSGWCLDNNFVEGCPASYGALNLVRIILFLLGPLSIGLWLTRKIEHAFNKSALRKALPR